MGEVELRRPEAQQRYTIDDEEWVVMQVVYLHSPGDRTIELVLKPLKEVQARYHHGA